MSQASEAIKAKRKQHRQDHYTDADRAFNGQGKKAKRAGRQEAFNAQGNESAADFNFDQHGKGHISGQEIAHLRKSGQSREQVMAAVQASGGELGGRAQKKLDKWGAAKEKAQAVIENPVTNNNGSNNDVDGTGNAVGIGNTATTGNTGDVKGDGTAVGIGNVAAGGNEVNGSGNATGIGNNANTQEDIGNMTNETTQDNDQANSIVGDNNYQYNNQDNSVRNYGGDTRVFNYQSSGGNPALDTPVSAATMGGFYGVDDSHAANAARLDRQSTQNRDLQKAYQNTSHIAQGAISRASQNSYTDPAKLDERIANREMANKAQSEAMRAGIFGDLGNYTAQPWQDAKPQEKVEKPDYNQLYNQYAP